MRTARQFTIVAIIIICSVSLRAGDLDLGIKLGYDHGRLANTSLPKYLSAAQIGLFAEQKMSEFYALRLELNFDFRGNQSLYLNVYDDIYDTYFYPFEWKARSYINLGTLTKLFPPARSWLMPYIEFGPSINIMVAGGKAEDTSGGQRNTDDYHADRVDLYFAIGGGFDIDPEGARLSIGLRFVNELTSSSYAGYENKNNYFSLSVGVMFRHLRSPL